MTPQIHKPEVQRLAAIASILSDDYKSDTDPWAGSPFAWIRNVPSSRTKGKIFEELVERMSAKQGLAVTKSPDSNADRRIAGLRAEIKGSTLWKGGTYRFQQIRDQNYRILVCLGISPFDAHLWVVPKDAVMRLWQEGKIISQHGGAAGNDTAWIKVDPASPPDWIHPYGGTLSTGFASLEALTSKV